MQLMKNMLCIAANKKEHGSLDSMHLRSGQGLKQHEDKIQQAFEVIENAPLYIDDTGGLKITDLKAKARRMFKQHDIKLFVLDYMQQLQPAVRCENRSVAMSEISNEIKALAKELNIPVLAVAQLNRSNAVHERPPRMSDLRESGTIEQDADVIILLHQLNDDDNDDLEGPRHVQAIIEKQRSGPQGICDMNFFSKNYLFNQRAYYENK